MDAKDDEDRPTVEVRKALNRLLERNRRTRGAEVAELYLGEGIFVARLARPVVIDGTAVTVQRTADLFDLMDDHQAERGW